MRPRICDFASTNFFVELFIEFFSRTHFYRSTGFISFTASGAPLFDSVDAHQVKSCSIHSHSQDSLCNQNCNTTSSSHLFDTSFACNNMTSNQNVFACSEVFSRLEVSPSIRSALTSKELQHIIRTIDTAPDRVGTLNTYLAQNEDFSNFVNEMLQVVK